MRTAADEQPPVKDGAADESVKSDNQKKSVLCAHS